MVNVLCCDVWVVCACIAGVHCFIIACWGSVFTIVVVTNMECNLHVDTCMVN